MHVCPSLWWGDLTVPPNNPAAPWKHGVGRMKGKVSQAAARTSGLCPGQDLVCRKLVTAPPLQPKESSSLNVRLLFVISTLVSVISLRPTCLSSLQKLPTKSLGGWRKRVVLAAALYCEVLRKPPPPLLHLFTRCNKKPFTG